jgi:hypothetical protein
MEDGEFLSMWTVYDHPTDFPDTFVARRFEIRGGDEPFATSDVMVAMDLEVVRLWLQENGWVCLGRYENDDPLIVETWV